MTGLGRAHQRTLVYGTVQAPDGRMRIGLAHSHPNTFGGGERALEQVARGLTARGHGVTLLLGRWHPQSTYPGLAEFPRVRLRGLDWLLVPPAPEVIVTFSFGANLQALLHGRRVVYWVHTLRSRFLTRRDRRPGLMARRVLDRVAVSRSARLVANSQYTAGRFPNLYGRAADAVVYPGVDLSVFRPAVSPQRSRGARAAVTVGRLAPEKGLERLFRVWQALPDLPLRVIGTGDPGYVGHLRACAPANVFFYGALPPEAVAAAFRDAVCAVFAPTDEEFGIAPLEALACAVPVVSMRSGGLSETVVDGETGFLVDCESQLAPAVRRLLGDHAQYQRMSARARTRAEGFSWGRCVDGIEEQCAIALRGSLHPPA